MPEPPSVVGRGGSEVVGPEGVGGVGEVVALMAVVPPSFRYGRKGEGQRGPRWGDTGTDRTSPAPESRGPSVEVEAREADRGPKAVLYETGEGVTGKDGKVSDGRGFTKRWKIK